MARFRQHRGAARANRIQVRVQRLGQLGLHFDVADFAGAVARLQIVDFGHIRVEGVVIGEHRVAFDRAGDVGAHALRVGVHLPHPLDHGLGIVRQLDRVAEALAHLLVAVEAGQPRHLGEHRLRLDQRVGAEEAVEAAHRFARQLQVRDLVGADRDEARVVDRHVGGLEQRIAEEAEGREVFVLQALLLLLVGRDPFQPGHRHHHRQQQEELGMLGHQRLDEEGALLGIEAGGNPVGDHFVGVLDDRSRVRVLAGQGVPVGDEVEAVVLLLQRDPVAERADQMAQVQPAGRPHAGDNARFHGRSTRKKKLVGGMISALATPVNINA
jgi:hypothetical protein